MDEKKELIQKLKNEGKTKSDVAEILNVSWNTVNKYWGKDEQLTTQEEDDTEKETDTITRKELSHMYKRFDEGALPVDIIIETGIKQAPQVFEQFCEDKKYTHPKFLYENITRMADDFYQMKKDVEVFKKDMNEMKGKVDKMYPYLKPIMDRFYPGE